MTMPPMVMYVHVAPPDRKPVRVWLPLFLLWPLVVLLLAPPLLILVLVDVLLWLAGRRYHHYSLLLVRAVAVLGDTRGMVVRIKDGETAVDVTVD